MNWGNVRVINDDVQQLGNMVPNHEHRNYDILGYMVLQAKPATMPIILIPV